MCLMYTVESYLFVPFVCTSNIYQYVFKLNFSTKGSSQHFLFCPVHATYAADHIRLI